MVLMQANVLKMRLATADGARAALAYLALTLGAAGTASIAPLVAWGLAIRGFR